jgi:hypothetical protein
MTPQERQLIDDLFSRLEKLEATPRDTEAEAAIMAGLRRAPNAVYALVQTALLQDEALKHAAARIEQLEAGERPQNQGSFLDSLRGSLFGGNAPSSQGSVPSVPPSNPNARPVWNSGQVLGQDGYADPRGAPGGYAQPGYGAPQAQGGGSSFLGTAAAAAAGMIGGSILMNSFRGLGGVGGGQQQSFGNTNTNPWGGSSGSSNDALARDAGINDVGKNNSSGIEDRRQSFADQAQDAQQDRDDDQDQYQDDDDGDFDDGGFDSDDSDYA